MCHQSVGLIARHLEANGIPTVTLSSARSITAAVRPPRSVFVDFPLGHTSGRPHAIDEQRAIVAAALRMAAEADWPGAIVDLPLEWDEDHAWKDGVLRPTGAGGATGSPTGDQRAARTREPVWQHDDDRLAAEAAHRDGPCGSCIGTPRCVPYPRAAPC